MHIYIFGNSILKQDSLPVKILPKLKKEFPNINFLHVDPTENWLKEKEDTITILDTVIGLDHVMTFDSLEEFTLVNKSASVHDYDVIYDLTIMQKLGKIKSITIIGIPSIISAKTALDETLKAIKKLKPV